MAPVTRSGRQSGVTLVELLVAFALLAAIAVLSAQLVIQSTRLIDTVASASRNPDLVIATEWLRRDLYETVTLVGGDPFWTDAPLVTLDQDGGAVVFASVDGQLVRTSVPPGGLALDHRVLLRGVVAWRWRVVGGGMVSIELEAFANPEAHRNPAGRLAPAVERRTERLSFALRGRPGGRAW